jgi:eukaryotic-like serine/threonine-protein kinase
VIGPSTKLGAYEIVSTLGAGGMGEVWLARDTRLGREVAIKVLPRNVANDSDRLARFEREARVLASLNHPNIAAIFEFDREAGAPFLVLEYVPGPTLAEAGKQESEDAVRIALQIADALEAAHDKGIIHRDLKPANIKITPAGRVKVLDFGLAKALADELSAGSLSPVSQSATLTAAATRAGVILGTAAYMSPEQARGKTVDKRADIWAFGCVLYEMLTGSAPFQGDTTTDVLAAVVRQEPDYQQVPARLRPILKHCLEKDAANRYRDIADVRYDLRAAAEARQEAPVTTPNRLRTFATYGALGIAAIAITAAVVIGVRPAPTPPQVVRSIVATSVDGSVAISPDGKRIAWSHDQSLYTRTLTEDKPRMLARLSPTSPIVFSADGQTLLITRVLRMWVVPVDGSQTVAVGAATSNRFATWGPGDRIFYSANNQGQLVSAPPTGGEPAVVKGGEGIGSIQPLLDGEWVLGVRRRVSLKVSTPAQIVALSLKTGESTTVLNNAGTFRYVDSGHLVYRVGNQGQVYAVAFDARRRVVTGAPVRVFQSVTRWDVSRTGHLVHTGEETGADSSSVLLLGDSKTALASVAVLQRRLNEVALSPDGKRVLLGFNGGDGDVWAYEFERKVLSRITADPGEQETPLWSPDGSTVAYASDNPSGGRKVVVRSGYGTGAPRTVWTGTAHNHLTSWSPDGKSMLMALIDIGQQGLVSSIVRLDVNTGKTEPLPTSGTDDGQAVYSPEGAWIAYVSNETGEQEVFLQPAAGGIKLQLTSEGGIQPRWSHDGHELYFIGRGKLKAIQINRGKPGATREVMNWPGIRRFDIGRDGRVITVGRDPAESTPPLYLVLNWAEELKQTVRATK